MRITTVLFDLDGTLLPMDQDVFANAYFRTLAGAMAPHGYDPKRLVDAVWAGTKAMVLNDGRAANEAVFWDKFTAVYGQDVTKDRPLFDRYYTETFPQVQSSCGYDPRAARTVRGLKAQGVRVVLATNPIFPAVATHSRIRWAGLEPEDFALVTTYENTAYCKPNPEYYRDILRRLALRPEECLMVGNDVGEDMVAAGLGMRVFLLTDCMINKAQADIRVYPHGDFDALAAFLADATAN